MTIKKFDKFINENKSTLFSYRGTELPTEEMIDWFSYDFNQEPGNMDSLEYDEWDSKLEKDFFEEFHNELMDLSYFQMIDIFNKARSKSLF